MELGDIRANGFHASEAFVTDDEVLVAGRRGTVFRSIDFFICPSTPTLRSSINTPRPSGTLSIRGFGTSRR